MEVPELIYFLSLESLYRNHENAVYVILINMKAMYSVRTVGTMTVEGGLPLWNISHWTFIRSIPGHE